MLLHLFIRYKSFCLPFGTTGRSL